MINNATTNWSWEILGQSAVAGRETGTCFIGLQAEHWIYSNLGGTQINILVFIERAMLLGEREKRGARLTTPYGRSDRVKVEFRCRYEESSRTSERGVKLREELPWLTLVANKRIPLLQT